MQLWQLNENLWGGTQESVFSARTTQVTLGTLGDVRITAVEYSNNIC